MELRISEIAASKINAMIEEGEVSAMIENETEKLINSKISEMFTRYGGIGKQIEAAICEHLEANPISINVESFSQQMSAMLKKAISNHLKDDALKLMEKALDSMFEPVPDSVTLQELVSMVAKGYKDDTYDNDRDDHLSFECDQQDYGWYDLKFWKQKSKYGSNRSPDIEIHANKDGEIVWLSGGSRDYGTHNYNVESMLYRMTIKRTKITDISDCDQDDFENTYIGIGRDY